MEKLIPYYDTDGKPRGYRTREAAERLLANEVVTAVYGRKGHLTLERLYRIRFLHRGNHPPLSAI